MPERKKPRNPYEFLSYSAQAEVREKAPDKSIDVRLPYVDYRFLFWGGRQYLSMHTDMMGVFCRTINSFKWEVRENLYVQTRAMTVDQWEEMREHPAYRFFYQRRLYRTYMENRKETVAYLVPKDLEITRKQLKEYENLEFTPKTLQDEIGFKLGWFKADYLTGLREEEVRYNSLAPFLGAVNMFRVGSDELTSGQLKKVAIQFALAFEEDEDRVRKSILDDIPDDVIRASANILRYGRHFDY